MSIRSALVSTFLLRPNKTLYRMFLPSPRFIRFVIHPQTWLWGKLLSPFGVRTENTDFGNVPSVTFTPKKNVRPNTIFVFLHGVDTVSAHLGPRIGLVWRICARQRLASFTPSIIDWPPHIPIPRL